MMDDAGNAGDDDDRAIWPATRAREQCDKEEDDDDDDDGKDHAAKSKMPV